MNRIPLALALALSAASVFADTVYLTNGATIEGRARYEGGKVVVEQLAGDIMFDESRVEMVDKKRTILDDYDDKLKALTANANTTADDYAGLARFAEENGIKRHIEASYRRAIAKDPAHAESRLALGYVKYEGVWMLPEKANVARGLVLHKGAWMTPEAKADLLRLEAQTEAANAQAEVERLKLARTEKQLEAIEAERDLRLDRDSRRNYTYNDGYYIAGGGNYWYRPGLGNPGRPTKPDRPDKPGKPQQPEQPRPQIGGPGQSMFGPSAGQSLFPRE